MKCLSIVDEISEILNESEGSAPESFEELVECPSVVDEILEILNGSEGSALESFEEFVESLSVVDEILEVLEDKGGSEGSVLESFQELVKCLSVVDEILEILEGKDGSEGSVVFANLNQYCLINNVLQVPSILVHSTHLKLSTACAMPMAHYENFHLLALLLAA